MSKLTYSERAADKLARFVGSWPFLIGQTTVLVIWLVINSKFPSIAWDPPGFLLLNLLLSFQASYTGPVVMMSQNRQAEIDRKEAQEDFMTNLRSESGVLTILKRMDDQDREIAFLRNVISSQVQVIRSQTMVISDELELKNEARMSYLPPPVGGESD